MAYRVKVCWEGGYEETYENIESFEVRGNYLFIYAIGRKGDTVPFRIFSDRDVKHYEIEELTE